MIGKGGMGEVYLAEHVRMQRAVAIKMLKHDRIQDEAAIDRFFSEIRAVAKLLHPNIVAAFDAGEFDGINYFVMEYVDGMTLTKWVSRSGPLPLSEAVTVIRQAALGLLHAHRSGIVHRDIKPGNIMRAADGTIKVLDMGLAQLGTAGLDAPAAEIIESRKSDADLKGRLVGTLAYMSPEQLESPETIDTRTDIYSLGCVLHFLLTARPPYVGEYLDQVYGHRCGEIPDLMQIREDIDLSFANIFRRMLAKTPNARYASLDEVIEDLRGYSDASTAPLWLAEFSGQQSPSDSTIMQGSTSAVVSTQVLGIDLGMFYVAAADANVQGDIQPLNAGDDNQSLLRAVLGYQGKDLLFDQLAMRLRTENPKQSVHCLPMYIGKDFVDREFHGRKCPPEVLIGILLRRVIQNAWPDDEFPEHVAITVPAAFDQFHRKSILQAATMAGLRSVRLVDRSVAAVQSILVEANMDSSVSIATEVESKPHKITLFVGLTGLASEVALFKHDSGQLTQLATSGHWHTGSLSWLHRLVDLASHEFLQQHNVNVRTSLTLGSALQVACEKAMNSMLLLPSVKISLPCNGEMLTVEIPRTAWLEKAEDLIVGLGSNIKTVFKQAGLRYKDVDTCLTMGPVVRLPEIRERLMMKFPEPTSVERTQVAGGAAACLAAELPGVSPVQSPRCVLSQSIGILVEDVKGRARILPIIPRGTDLPARTNRRLTVSPENQSMSLSLVESSGVQGKDWQKLGNYVFEVGEDETSRMHRTRMIGFEVDVNGLLTVRAQKPGQHGSSTLESLPKPVLADDQIPQWSRWITSLLS